MFFYKGDGVCFLQGAIGSLSGFIGRIEGKASSARFNHRLVIETVIENDKHYGD